MKKYIKMNTGKNYLSLGNLFYYIKQISINKSNVLQNEVFLSLFNCNNINNTTVNNYCIGYRPIGLDYKKIIIEQRNKYYKDKNVFISNVLNLVMLLDDVIYKEDSRSLYIINNNNNLKILISKLISISKEDISINEDFISNIELLYKNNDLYNCFVNIFLYCVLDNKQPIYNIDIDIDINKEELNEYLKIKLYEGVSYVTSLKLLSKSGNMYANAELGSLEYSGLINGSVNYNDCFKYYLVSAKKNHPKSCYMVAYLILNNKVDNNYNLAWKYLEKAIKYGSVAAINTMALSYLSGNNPNNEINESKAIKLLLDASDYGYTYSFNNLGLYYENNNNIKKALYYYKLSADMDNSWALNKIGEYYRKNNDLKTAFFYYKKASESPISELSYYSFYNLAKYYYLVGNKELCIDIDIEKGINYLNLSLNNGIKESKILLDKIKTRLS